MTQLIRRFLLGLFLFSATVLTAADIAPATPEEKNIDRLVGEIFSQMHYSQHPLDKEMSAKFFNQYINSLDAYHIHFLQSDLEEFEPYRKKLDTLTLKSGDTELARAMFKRFMERFEQRMTFTTNLILSGKFDFTGNDRYTPDRRKMTAPKTLDELHELWRQEVRYQYLNEKLNARDIQFTGPATATAKGDTSFALTRDKTHPLAFTILPEKFYSQNHHLLGTVKISETGSNATVRLEGRDWKKMKKLNQDIYAKSGEKLGSVALRHATNVALEEGKWVLSTNTMDVYIGKEQKGPAHLTNTVPTTNAFSTNTWYGSIQLNQKNMADVVKNLTNRYVRLQKNFREYTADNVFEIYLESLARAYDPHSDYMGPDQSEDFNIQMKLSLFGIGAKLIKEDDYCKIEELIAGPAQKSGKIQKGDKIVAVAQGTNDPVDVVGGMKLSKIVSLIRGPKGTEVRLTIIPTTASDSSVRVVVPIIRAEIQIEDSRAKAFIYEMPRKSGEAEKIGLIDLPGFYSTTTADVSRLLRRLMAEHVDGVILDLRQNGGGYLDEAVNLTGLFIKKGPVVQTKTFNGDIEIDKSQNPTPMYDGPLVVLTSRFSASASEILAGALQDYGRALIVGDHATYGKGTVQTVLQLKPYLAERGIPTPVDPGTVKITIKKFYRAGGSSTQNKGVLADVELPSKNSAAEVGEEFMENALGWDTVTSADPENLNRVQPYLAELKRRAALRLQSNKELVYWTEDVEHFKKMMLEKSVSLNEAERLADTERDKARAEQRKKERASRKKDDQKTFEINFGNITDAELHPPVVKTNEVGSVSADSINFDEDSELEGAQTPAADKVILDEAKRVMSDYIELMKKNGAVTKAH